MVVRVIAIVILAGAIAFVAIRWGNALERTLPGTPTIGTDIRVPRAVCKPTAYRRGIPDSRHVRRLNAARTDTSQES